MIKRYLGLIALVTAILIVAIAIRFRSVQINIFENTPAEKYVVYDTIKIISTPEALTFRAKNIELNGASIEDLKSIYGIGPVFSERIVKYRTRLGGYSTIQQLREVKGITKEVYANISPNLYVNPLAIQKININFATLEQLKAHPYFSPSMAGRLCRAIKMKGGYYSLDDLLTDDIILPGEAQKIAPYISF